MPDLEDKVIQLFARDLHRRAAASSPVSIWWDESYLWEARSKLDTLKPSELLNYISIALTGDN
jgi:hypothetical protein